MTPSLHATFSEHARLSLIWVDTSCLHEVHQSGTRDPESLKIIESSVAALDGAVFSVDSIVSVSGPWLCGRFKSRSNIQDEDCTNGDIRTISMASILSATSVFKNCFQSKPKHHCEKIHGSLTLSEESKSTELFLELVPAADEPSLHRHEETGDTSNDVFPTTLATAPSSSCNDRSINSRLQNPRFSVIASVEKTTALSWLVQPSRSYIVYDAQTPPLSQSVTLCDLLLEMSNCQQILVLQVQEADYVLPSLAILDLHTLDSACISFLSIGSSLEVEKAVFRKFHNVSPTSDDTEEMKEPIVGVKDFRVSDMKRINVRESKERTKNIEMHLDHIKSKCSLHESSRKKSGCVSQSWYDPQVLNPWHIAGSTKGLVSVIEKLTASIDQLNFLTLPEKEILINIQQQYRKCNRPFIVQKAKTVSVEESKTSVPVPSSDVGQQKLSLCKQKSGLFRGELMVKRSRAVVKEGNKLEDKLNQTDGSGTDKDNSRCLLDVPKMEFASEGDLGLYIEDVYNKLVESSGGLEFGVQTIVTVSLHFMKHHSTAHPEKSLMDLFGKYILLSAAILRNKYKENMSSGDKNNKITEFQLQILLRLELECAVLDTDSNRTEQVVEEVVALLRSLSFITDSGFVPAFLNKDLLTSYRSTLPKLLVSIYDELMQPLPDILAGFGSPESSLNLSVLNQSGASSLADDAVLSVSQPVSDKSDILQSQSSRNLRSRKLSQHPSIDYGVKKQIVVIKPMANKKDKNPAHNKSAQPCTRSRKENVKRKSEVVKVRRNLFEKEKPKLERCQSVAVMEHVKRTPRKKSSLFKSPQSSKSPRLQKKVAETPSHKQLSHAIWRKQDVERRRANSLEDVQVVSESPLKTSQGNMNKYSPARSKHAVNMLRRSFYSAQPRNRSRNLTKFLELAHKIGGSHSLSLGNRLSTGNSSDKKTSPNQSTFLFSQLLGSPSPRGKTLFENNQAQSVEDSPFKNTRSKTPTKTITRMLSFDSPQNKMTNQQNSDSVDKTPKIPSSGQGLLASSALRSSPHNMVLNQLEITPTKVISKAFSSGRTTPKKIVSSDHVCEESPGRQQLSEENVLCSSVRITRSRADLNSPETPTKYFRSPSQSVSYANSHGSPQRHSVGSFFKRLDSEHQCSSPFKCAYPSPKRSNMSSTPKREETNAAWCSLQSTPRRCGKTHAESVKSPVTPSTTPKSCLSSPQIKSLFRVSPEKRVHFGKSAISSLVDDHLGRTECLKDTLQEQNDSKMSVKNQLTSSPTATGAGTSLRTPSPCGKRNVKTPDSLDKWPRRKKRWVSPLEKGSSSVHTAKEQITLRPSLQTNQSDGFTAVISRSEADRMQKTSSSRSKKRSRHSSPASSVKRQRLSVGTTDLFSKNSNEHSHMICDTSIEDSEDNFEADIPFQLKSIAGYCSTVSDDVFLSDSSVISDKSSCQQTEHRVGFRPQELFETSKTRSHCDQNLASGRSSSPVFNTSPHRRLSRSRSSAEIIGGENNNKSSLMSTGSQGFECSVKSSQSKQLAGDDAVSSSPRLRGNGNVSCDQHDKTPLTCNISPQHVKFSPSVSAKSLIHLMHSPLIQSPHSNASSSESDCLRSPSSTWRQRNVMKSKKMLNLQN
ncbi:treslin-like [Gigantopelta aegis]|uniref:treslin-like n=1 Tax=Gigantopelta aegis TaxID=1735272 RepID=UPI001B88CA9E|nr:treslin-like [Gigantopelta aegis]